MKKYQFLLAFVLVLLSLCANTQNTNYKQGISFKALVLDYQTLNDGAFSRVKDYHTGFEIAYSRFLQENLNLVIPFKVGIVNDDVFDITRLDQGRLLNKGVYSLDAILQYQFFTPEKKVVPLLYGGIGFVNEVNSIEDNSFNLQLPLGVGAQIKIRSNAYATLQGEYRIAFLPERANLQYSLGFVYLIGKGKESKEVTKKIDTDGDGVIDNLDLCPQIPGLESMSGCPDEDGDGVADYQDRCPGIAGLIDLGGCPDKDGDGIADIDDQCPDEVGLIENNGCPDTSQLDSDNDGVVDSEDKCPNIAGPASNGGCPFVDSDNDGVPDDQDLCPKIFGNATAGGCPDKDGDGIPDQEDKCPNTFGPAVYGGCPDTDGDGIDDGRDRCPNTPGPVTTNGCPEISQADLQTLDLAMRAVQFDTGRSTLKSESFSVLNQIADIMRRYPDYNIAISGHTDNTGSATANQKLSERRAKACYEYLTTRGIVSDRMNFVGYGESRPISDNNSLRGRSLNRRVEFKLIPAR